MRGFELNDDQAHNLLSSQREISSEQQRIRQVCLVEVAVDSQEHDVIAMVFVNVLGGLHHVVGEDLVIAPAFDLRAAK
jgi:hypothetical protein